MHNKRKSYNFYASKRELPCDYCGKTFPFPSRLKRHIEYYHTPKTEKEIADSRVKCGFCNQTYARNSELQRHIRRIHLRLEVTKCDYCDMTLASKASLAHHIKQKHEEDTGFRIPCPKCDKCFRYGFDLPKCSFSGRKIHQK